MNNVLGGGLRKGRCLGLWVYEAVKAEPIWSEFSGWFQTRKWGRMEAERECCDDGHPTTWHCVLGLSLPPARALLPGLSESLQGVIPTNSVGEEGSSDHHSLKGR